MQCRLNVNSLNRALVMDLYTVQWAVPSKTNTNKANKTKNTQNNNKTKTTKHREVGSLLALRHKMHDVILCVVVSMATEKKQNNDNREQNKRGHARGWKKQQSSMRKPGIPPARIPEITESSHSGITFTQALRSKQRRRRVATRVVKN